MKFAPMLNRKLRWKRILLAAAMLLAGALAAWSFGLALERQAEREMLGESTAQVLRRMENILAEAAALFDQLDRSLDRSCSDGNLARLRSFMFDAHYIRDIGVVENRTLMCSSSLGRVRDLEESEPPDVVLPGGILIDADQPVRVSEYRRTMVIQRGGYNVLVDPAAITDLMVRYPGGRIRIRAIDGEWFDVLPQAPTRSPTASTGPAGKLVDDDACSARFGLCVSVHRPVNAVPAAPPGELALIAGLGALSGLGLYLFGIVAVQNHRSLPSQLRRALRRQHITAVYQPIVELPDGRICAVEALARWRDESGREVDPDEFITLAEELALVTELTILMIRTVARELGPWLRRDVRRQVAINISAQDLERAEFEPALYEQLVGKGIREDQIVLEVTERSMLTGVEPRVAELAHRGFRIFVDDFGEGYSGLASLDQLEVQGIKISKIFTGALGTDSPKAALVPTIIELARKLGLSVIVEGLESMRQLEALEDLTPLYGQGWIFSRPVTARELESMVDSIAPASREAR